MISFSLTASNKEDWMIQFSATDEDTGNPIDFTGATISFALREQDNWTRITASTTDGTITQPVAGTVEIAIPESAMQQLCPGSYQFGCIYELNSVTAQLFTGVVAIYDGIACL